MSSSTPLPPHPRPLPQGEGETHPAHCVDERAESPHDCRRFSLSPRVRGNGASSSRVASILTLLLTLITAHCLLITSTNAAPAPFELKDGDRVVFLGDTFIEREQYYGWIELMLTTRFSDRNVTFRNLGWSADTPAGDSRFGLSLLQAGKEPPDE